MDDLCTYYSQYRSSPSREVSERRSTLIGELRWRLSLVCIDRLEPELVIVDEFQRFKHILDQDSEDAALARKLFDYPRVRTLLVSATPYKMCTFEDEGTGEDHYDDFLKTLAFLAKQPNTAPGLREALRTFRRQLLAWPDVDRNAVVETKRSIEEALGRLMSRVERVGMTARLDAMIRTIGHEIVPTSSDLRDYCSYKGVAKAVSASSSVEYWKSAPHLLTALDGYELRTVFEGTRLTAKGRKCILDLKRETSRISVPFEALDSFQAMEPANARLRLLHEHYFVERATGKLLWMPPSKPYYKVGGVYGEAWIPGLTKALIFSSWKMVPRVVASICSYEAERVMLGPQARSLGYAGSFPDRRLEYVAKDGVGSPVVVLGFASKALADAVDPLAGGNEDEATAAEILKAATDTIRAMLDGISIPRATGQMGRVDPQWYLFALLTLEREYASEAFSAWKSRTASYVAGNADGEEGAAGKGRQQQMKAALELAARSAAELGAVPADLDEVLALLALAGPAIVARRALCRMPESGPDEDVAEAAGFIAEGFRSLFNRPDATGIVDQEGQGETYWVRTLRYSLNGNIQAMLDEYLHLLWASVPSSSEDGETRHVIRVAGMLHRVMTLKTVGHRVHDVSDTEAEVARSVAIRCRFALAYGDWNLEGEKDQVRAELVRDAFNSPFHPFILATTSVGQEGLDFHGYCHAIYHWNLPRNPVDLEQREGRINRYKGHVVRKNLAARYRMEAGGKDPWAAMFATAAAAEKGSAGDLNPYWLCSDPSFWVERHVPYTPLSREEANYRTLRKALGLYRIAFGQPRQEDLMSHLDSAVADEDLNAFLREAMIDLSPPEVELGDAERRDESA
jgi:hypothetical protein